MKKTILLLTLLIGFIWAQPMQLRFDTKLAENNRIYIAVIGNTDITVNWGDGKSNSYTKDGYHSHIYDSPGTYTVSITGNLENFGRPSQQLPALVEVISFGDLGLTGLNNAFEGADNLTKVPNQIPSSVTSVKRMFYNAIKFNDDISGWNMSNITDMSYMFCGAQAFNQDIGSWDVSKVTDMSYMFYGAQAFNQPLENWIVSKVTDMSRIFWGAKAFNQDINDWNVSQVTNMYGMFAYTDAFNQDIGNWNTGSVTDMSYMFRGAQAFNQDISNWDVSKVTTMSYMFRGAQAFNQDISNWDVSKVTTMSYMFAETEEFNQDLNNWELNNLKSVWSMFYKAKKFNGNIANWRFPLLTSLDHMFRGTISFNQNINDWDVSKITDFSYTFADALAFDQPLDKWNVSQGKNFGYMFDGTQFNQNINNWDVSNATSMRYMFGNDSAFNQPLDKWDVSQVADMESIFSGARAFNQDISNWNLRSAVSLQSMFAGARAFNQDISGWNTSNVENMGYMFKGATAFNQDISSWNTDKVTSMRAMFADTDEFNQDISSWNMSNVKYTNDMFNGARAFNQNIGNWNTSSVINMWGMFANTAVFNQNIGGWDVSKVTDMSRMFMNSQAFDQNIGGWDVSKVTNMSRMFMNSQAFDQNIGSWDISQVKYMDSIFIDMTLSTANYDSILCKWSQLELQKSVKFHGGNSKYSPGLPAASRALLEKLYYWKITDGGSLEIDNAPLILVFDTELSPGNTITLALNYYVDAIVDWGDGNTDTVKTPGLINHDYAQPGQYTVSVSGTVIWFGDENQATPNIEKLVEVKSFGDVGLIVLSQTFNNAINLRKVPSSLPTAINCLDFIFTGASVFDQNLSSWDISNVLSMHDMFDGTALSTANYNRILEEWSKLPVQSGVELGVGATMYSPGAPATARQKLSDDFGWVITDGGLSDLPAITAATVVETTDSAASLSAKVTHDGGSVVNNRGLVWATTPQPTLAQDNVVAAGSALGEFSASITNLSCAQPYYVRSYATNGAGTVYGTEISFLIPCKLTLAGSFVASDKSYDGKATAAMKTNNLELQGVVTGHQVELSDVVVEFAAAKVGSDISVSIKSAQLSGADKANYTLSLSGAPTAKADISENPTLVAPIHLAAPTLHYVAAYQRLEVNASDAQVRLYTISGDLLKEHRLTSPGSVDLAFLSPGVYVVQLRSPSDKHSLVIHKH